jgi:hypothetical protein
MSNKSYQHYDTIINKLAIIVWYHAGMRGNSILRILYAHDEVFWDPKIQIASNKIISHPLDLPEDYSSFDYTNKFPHNISITNLQVAYSSYHIRGFIEKDHSNLHPLIDKWIKSKAYLEKKLFLINHPQWSKNKPYYTDLLLTLDNTPHIWVYGTLNRLTMPILQYAPSTNPQAYNLNIDALYSTDYITFETEYYKLINHFNLTSCLNRVRAFILLSLERENYISKFY